MPTASKPPARKTAAARRAKPSGAARAPAPPPSRANATPTTATRELSGRAWVKRFPGSDSPDDLTGTFKTAVKQFLAALGNAGAKVSIAATFRPPERAYLMHFAWEIAESNIDPRNVPPMAGVDIEWWHGALGASRTAAREMVEAYGMAQVAALRSRHTERKAIDMSITWSGSLTIKNAGGQAVAIATTPRSGLNPKLHAVGRTYGVIKLVSDRPHWSSDGH